MREIRNAEWRNKHHISFNDAEERVSAGAKVMASFGNMAAIASTVNRADLQDLFHKRYGKRRNIPAGIREPDYLCFIAYAAFMLGQVYNKWPEAERVNFVISRKKKVRHHIGTFRDELQKLMKPPLVDLVGDLIPASPEDQLPLQAADALLWHIQRYYASGRDQRKMNASDRIHLANLIHNGGLDGTVHTWERSELVEMAEQWTDAGLIPKP